MSESQSPVIKGLLQPHGEFEKAVETVTRVKLKKYKTLIGLLRGRRAYIKQRNRTLLKEMSQPLHKHFDDHSAAITETPFVQTLAFSEAILCRATDLVLSGKKVPVDVLEEFPELNKLINIIKESEVKERHWLAEKKKLAKRLRYTGGKRIAVFPQPKTFVEGR